MKAENMYRVAVYLRLSRDDGSTLDLGAKRRGSDIGGTKNESSSISSQRDLICSFINKHDDMDIYDTYIDDGYSGVDFNRPGFKRMMEDIKAGNVDCVIVKDLSRLGRDYIEAGRLIHKTFPAFCIRFIAIIDNFDSLTADSNEKTLIVPVKNFINDSYCRDISKKIKSSQRIKRENGEFIGAYAVYGYKKDNKNKNKLVIDDYAAGIVKNIFAWKLEGMSTIGIAERLNALGILSPLEYKRFHGEKISTGFMRGRKAKWSAVAVKRILVNKTFTGALVQGKEEKINYKIKKSVKKPESEWICVENTHEAIISKEVFKTAGNLLKVDTRAEKGKDKAHIFSGFLYCGDCREAMIRRVNRSGGSEHIYFICRTKNKGDGCSRHSIEESVLIETVFHSISTNVSLFLQKNEQLAYLEKKEIWFDEVMKFEEEIAKLRKDQDKYITLHEGLYEDLKEGLLTEQDYKSLQSIYKRQLEESQRAIEGQEQMIKALFKSGVTAGVNLDRFKETIGIAGLDRNSLISFVDRIDVYENKQVEITFRFKENFEKMLLLSGCIDIL